MKAELVSRLTGELNRAEFQAERVLPGQILTGKGCFQDGRRVCMLLHGPDDELSAHTRSYAELLYQCRGGGVYRVNDRELTLTDGELLLLGQNSLLELPRQSGGALAARFLIKPELFGDILRFLGDEETPLRSFILRCMGQETPYGYLHFRVSDVQQVENLMENLILHFLDHPMSRRAIPMFTMAVLFMELMEQTDRVTIGIREQMSVLRVLQYVEANYAHVSLTTVAKELHCDVSWLSREIRNRTGRTFTEIVQDRRLTQAAWLLSNTRQKVSDIALSVGYENVSYFHRIFAKRFGCSPKKYRDTHS